MLKAQNKKMSPEFIAYLKNTPEIPQKRKTKQQSDIHNQQSLKHQSRITQGDFSKISCSYVLQNERLRKKSIIYNKNHKAIQQQGQCQIKTEDIEMIKKIAKLQYLQKKGYLKPQEKQILNKLRGNNKAQKRKRCYQEIPQSLASYQDKENQQDIYNMPMQILSMQKSSSHMMPQHYFYPQSKLQQSNSQLHFQQTGYNPYCNQHQINPNHIKQTQYQNQFPNQFMGYKYN